MERGGGAGVVEFARRQACVRVLSPAVELDSGPEDELLGAAVVTEALASLWRLRCSPPSLGSGFTFWLPQPAVNIP